MEGAEDGDTTGDGDLGAEVADGRLMPGAAGARLGLVVRGDGRARGACGAGDHRFEGREVAGLPEQEKLFQAAENARENGHDESLKRIGQPGTRRVGLRGSAQAGEAVGQGKGGMN